MSTRSSRTVTAFLLISLAVGWPLQSTAQTPAKSTNAQRVAVQGGELEYSVSGSGEPVLLIHGSIFADAFPPLLPEPALSNYQLITYDRRGFAGSSRAPVPFTIEQQAADAIALLDKLDIRRAHVVGASYGGTIALQMARQYPDRLASLSLFEAAVPSLDTMDPRLMEAVHAAGELYGKGDARGAVSRFVNAVVPGAWDRMTAEGATAMQEQAVADAGTFFEVELPALQAWQYSASDLANVKTPTLVVLGGKTDPSSRTSHGQLLRGIKGAQELVVQGAGHELHMSQPKSVADALAAFLRQHPIR